MRKELDAAQSQLKEEDAHTLELTTELEKTKKETYAQLAAEKEASQRQFDTITNEATKKLSESEKRVSDLTEQLKSVSAQVEQLKTEKDAAQSKLTENQSEFGAMENELAKAKEATQEATARATELEKAANQATEAEAERAQIQSALDQANKEIEQLKTQLEQQQAAPPVSVSPAPEEAAPPLGQ